MSDFESTKVRIAGGGVAIIDADLSGSVPQRGWRPARGGYPYRRTKDGHISLARYVMNAGGVSVPDGCVVDHINRDILDNRLRNLRVGTKSENGANRQKTSKTTTSRYKGVHYACHLRRWVASIRKDGVLSTLGYFENEVDAAVAYDLRAIEVWGSFARPNFLEAWNG